MYPLYDTVLRQLQKCHHRIHRILDSQPLKPLLVCCRAACCSAESSAPCPWSGWWGRPPSLSLWAGSHALLRARCTIRTQFNTVAVHPLAYYLRKFVSHGICSSVSLSLTVPRHWVKRRGVTSSSLSVIARMTTLHKNKACSSFLGASWLPCISKKMHAYICMHIYINYNIWNQSSMQTHLKK